MGKRLSDRIDVDVAIVNGSSRRCIKIGIRQTVRVGGFLQTQSALSRSNYCDKRKGNGALTGSADTLQELIINSHRKPTHQRPNYGLHAGGSWMSQLHLLERFQADSEVSNGRGRVAVLVHVPH